MSSTKACCKLRHITDNETCGGDWRLLDVGAVDIPVFVLEVLEFVSTESIVFDLVSGVALVPIIGTTPETFGDDAVIDAALFGFSWGIRVDSRAS